MIFEFIFLFLLLSSVDFFINAFEDSTIVKVAITRVTKVNSNRVLDFI